MEFKDKVVVITGSSSGIGAQLAVEFSRLGSKVVITGRRESKLHEVAAKCIESSPVELKPLLIQADVTKQDDLSAIVFQTISSFGGLDILINNAGMAIPALVTDKNFCDAFDKVISANLGSAVKLTSLFAEELIKSKGVVVNISSVLGTRPNVASLSYCVSKAGLDMATKCLALELSPSGVRVNGIAPAVIDTDMWQSCGFDEAMKKIALEHCNESYPVGRFGEVADVVSAVKYLASKEASFVTGTTLELDGGFLLTSAGMMPKN